MGFVIVSIINITVQSVSQIETGIATAMNTIFRTIGAVIGPAIAGVFLARYVSPLVAQASFGSVMGPLVPNESVRLCIPRRAGRLARRQRDGAFSEKNGSEIERHQLVEEITPGVRFYGIQTNIDRNGRRRSDGPRL